MFNLLSGLNIFKSAQSVISSYTVHSSTVSAFNATPQLYIHMLICTSTQTQTHRHTHTHTLSLLHIYGILIVRPLGTFQLFSYLTTLVTDYNTNKVFISWNSLLLSRAKYHAFHFFVLPLSALLIFFLSFSFVFLLIRRMENLSNSNTRDRVALKM